MDPRQLAAVVAAAAAVLVANPAAADVAALHVLRQFGA